MSDSDHVQLSIHLSGAVKTAIEALASETHKTPQALIEGWVNERVIGLQVLDTDEATRLAAEFELFSYLDEVLDELRHTKWNEDVTLDVFARIENEKQAVYDRAHGGDKATQNRINKRIGARIKESLGAVTRPVERGTTPRKGNVSKGLIRTYTKLWRS